MGEAHADDAFPLICYKTNHAECQLILHINHLFALLFERPPRRSAKNATSISTLFGKLLIFLQRNFRIRCSQRFAFIQLRDSIFGVFEISLHSGSSEWTVVAVATELQGIIQDSFATHRFLM